ncbi:hypothetical protein A9Q81_15195 [Gammaproteobacteria bacterium 42_54_T18]|nr:hypothetical protein A9Q81_15195 [Gammaproteobacteria bacterium 42_54_T18]
MKSKTVKTFIATLIAQILFISAPSHSYARDTLYIITNTKNATQSLSKQDIQNIFLGKIQSFPNGNPAKPVNSSKGSPSRIAFMEEILKKTERSWRSHWARLLFTGKGKPPKEYQNPQDIIDAVAQKKQAIGYVIGNIDKNSNITILMKITIP